MAFRLHDTFGFPVELTQELIEERGLSVDMDRFAVLMEEQRRRAQEAVKKGAVGEQAIGDAAARVGRTEFLGYQTTAADARVDALFLGGVESEAAQEGQDVLVLLNRTPFYAEGGGQVGDQGVIRTEVFLADGESPPEHRPGARIITLLPVEHPPIIQRVRYQWMLRP